MSRPNAIGYRLVNSNVVHLPWWTSRGGTMRQGSACGRAPWTKETVWSTAEGFEGDDLRQCVLCVDRVKASVAQLSAVLDDFIVAFPESAGGVT